MSTSFAQKVSRSLYDRFCRRALAEGDTPNDMKGFLEYVVNWLDRERRETMAKKAVVWGVVAFVAVKIIWGKLQSH